MLVTRARGHPAPEAGRLAGRLSKTGRPIAKSTHKNNSRKKFKALNAMARGREWDRDKRSDYGGRPGDGRDNRSRDDRPRGNQRGSFDRGRLGTSDGVRKPGGGPQSGRPHPPKQQPSGPRIDREKVCVSYSPLTRTCLPVSTSIPSHPAPPPLALRRPAPSCSASSRARRRTTASKSLAGAERSPSRRSRCTPGMTPPCARYATSSRRRTSPRGAPPPASRLRSSTPPATDGTSCGKSGCCTPRGRERTTPLL